jgi:hypothetical protein
MRKIFSKHFLLVAFGMLALCSASFAQFGVVVSFGPPELPVYDQPVCPADGYIWTPGYWAWDGYDYYWVPGTWVLAPQPGYFWTPAWWGWGGSGFIFHEGYWGPRVGFYGGINYGFGYFGHGYEGGHWDHDHFFYNRTVNNVNVNIIHNTYNTTIVNNYGNSRVSYNGGRGGIESRATSLEESAARERHIAPVRAQVEHVQAARGNPEFRASSNHGKPAVAATSRPGAFSENPRVSASEGRGYGSNSVRPENYSRDPGSAVHPKELPPNSRLGNPNTGNSGRDQKYQQQQQQLYGKQEQDRQQLQQRQEQEHQQYSKQQASQEKMQQLERQHQQQTQQMAQQHYQQQVQMQQREQPRESGRSESGHNKEKH